MWCGAGAVQAAYSRYKSKRDLKRIAGITLLETLLGVAIVAVLAGLATVGVRSTLSKARSARELGAARNVIVAYLAFAGDQWQIAAWHC